MNVGHFEIDVVHRADSFPVQRPCVDHHFNNVVSLARQPKFDQPQISGFGFVTPDFFAVEHIPIEPQHGIHFVPRHDYARVLQVIGDSGSVQKLSANAVLLGAVSVFHEVDPGSFRGHDG